MSDLINRADAIEAVAQQWLFEASVENPYVNDDDIGEYRKLAEELFEDVPSADAEWILCSERLPEKDELVLVTVWNDVTIAWRNIYGGWESAEDMYEKGDVTAWMPLPKPYREDGE